MVTRKRIQGETLQIAVLPNEASISTLFAVFKGPTGPAVNTPGIPTSTVCDGSWVIGARGWTDFGYMAPVATIFTITQDTSAFGVGIWTIEVWGVAPSGAKTVVVRESFEIAASVANGGTNDNRTKAEQAVEAIETLLANPDNIAAQSYKINNRELARYSIAELRSLLGYWKTEVRKANIKARGLRGVMGARIVTRF